MSPINGNTRASYSNVNDGEEPGSDAITGLHLFKKESPDSSSRYLAITLVGDMESDVHAYIFRLKFSKGKWDAVSKYRLLLRIFMDMSLYLSKF